MYPLLEIDLKISCNTGLRFQPGFVVTLPLRPKLHKGL